MGNALPTTILISVILLYLVTVLVLTSRFKSRHYATWDRLGRFSLITNNSISNGWKFLQYFVLSNSYEELNDPTLGGLAIATKVLLAASTAMFIWNALLVR